MGDLGDHRIRVDGRWTGWTGSITWGRPFIPSNGRWVSAWWTRRATPGVGHFVFSSVLHAITTDLVQHEIKRDIEEHLLSSGLEFTILQPANYMLPLKLKPVFERGVFELSWSLTRRQSMVDLSDVADVACLVLADPQAHAGATYELVGPGPLHRARARRDHRRRARPTDRGERDRRRHLPCRVVRRRRPGVFAHQARVLRAISARYSSHDFVGNPNVLSWLLGRPPTTFEQFVRRELLQTIVPRPIRLSRMRLTGNTILVTGGGSGIGRALAEEFHRRGNTVIIAGRRAAALAEVTAANPGWVVRPRCVRRSEYRVGCPGDPGRASRARCARQQRRHHGRRRRHRAPRRRPLVDIVSTNLLGPIRMVSSLIEHLKARPSATIINVSSMLGYAPLATSAQYSASKAGLHSYTLSLRYLLDGNLGRRRGNRAALHADRSDGRQPARPEGDAAGRIHRGDHGRPGDRLSEAYVERARQRRDAMRSDEIDVTRRFNDMMML